MPEPRDECREVTLPSGIPIRLRGAGELTPEAVSALGELVDATRTQFAATHPDAEEARALWARVDLARGDLLLRGVAHAAGVTIGALFRIMQGNLPDDADRAALERWLDEVGLPSP